LGIDIGLRAVYQILTTPLAQLVDGIGPGLIAENRLALQA